MGTGSPGMATAQAPVLGRGQLLSKALGPTDPQPSHSTSHESEMPTPALNQYRLLSCQRLK